MSSYLVLAFALCAAPEVEGLRVVETLVGAQAEAAFGRAGAVPRDVTRDGVLGFSIDPDEGAVEVHDLLNDELLATVPVGADPRAGALLADDTAYVVACAGSGELIWINSASFEIVSRTAGVGPGPIALTPDGRFALVTAAAASAVSLVEVPGRTLVGTVAVGEQPGAVRVDAEGRRAYVSCAGGSTVAVLALPDAPVRPASAELNQVLVLGTIHGGHRTSERYGLDLLRELVRAVAPDFILTEIPPNRAREALRGFLADGAVSEPRVLRFPEYVDVVYPLLGELGFEIIPTAGWSEPMARFRSRRLSEIAADPARAADWAAYEAANAASEACLEEHGASDDPRFIHSERYDACNDLALSVYDELFNDELGPGGWTNINVAHFAHIAAALDRHRGEGRRFLVTYGAGHKGWFLRELRKRDDIELLVLEPFLEQAEAVLNRR